MLAAIWLALRPEGAAAVLMRSWLRRGTEPLEPKVQRAAVQSDAGGKSMAVRFRPCSSSNSNSSLEGKSATLHKCMHAFLFFLSLSSSQLRFLPALLVAGCLRSRVLRDWLPAIAVHGRPGAVLDGLGNSLGTALIGHDGSPLAWSSNALAACRSAWCSMASLLSA